MLMARTVAPATAGKECNMTQDRMEGKAKDTMGGLKEQAGSLTGDQETEAKGTADQAEGKAQGAMGKVKDAVGDATDKVKEKVDR